MPPSSTVPKSSYSLPTSCDVGYKYATVFDGFSKSLPTGKSVFYFRRSVPRALSVLACIKRADGSVDSLAAAAVCGSCPAVECAVWFVTVPDDGPASFVFAFDEDLAAVVVEGAF